MERPRFAEGVERLVAMGAAVALVFLGGILQVATMVVNAREKTLETIRSHPRNQRVTTGSATIEILVESQDQVNTTCMDSGSWLVLGRGTEPLLTMTAPQAIAQQTGDGHVRWRAVLDLYAKDQSVGKPLAFLNDAEFVQFAFWQLNKPARVTAGTVVVTFNGTIRLEFPVPPQNTIPLHVPVVPGAQYVISRDLAELRSLLK